MTAAPPASPPGTKAPPRLGDRPAIALAFGLGLGLSPVMPGTCGSLPGLLLGAGIRLAGEAIPDAPLAARAVLVTLLLAAAALAAWWLIARTEAVLAVHDDQRIVIDEVVGQALAVAFVPIAWPWYVAGFVLFRLLDITKPWLIGRIDREVPGALGTLGDDLLAGLASALVLVAARQLL